MSGHNAYLTAPWLDDPRTIGTYTSKLRQRQKEQQQRQQQQKRNSLLSLSFAGNSVANSFNSFEREQEETGYFDFLPQNNKKNKIKPTRKNNIHSNSHIDKKHTYDNNNNNNINDNNINNNTNNDTPTILKSPTHTTPAPPRPTLYNFEKDFVLDEYNLPLYRKVKEDLFGEGVNHTVLKPSKQHAPECDRFTFDFSGVSSSSKGKCV